MSKRFLTRSLATFAVAGFALLSTPRDAKAILAIAFTIDDGAGGAATVLAFAVDNNVIPAGYTPGAGYVQILDTNAAVGTLELATFTPIPNYTVQGNIQSQTVATSVGSNNILNTGATFVTNDTGGTVTATVAVSATDYLGPITQAFASGSITWENAVGSSIAMGWYDDAANGQGAENNSDTPGILVHSFSDTAVFPADSGSTAAGPVAVNDPAAFSMSLGFTLTTIDVGAGNGSAARAVNRGQTEIKPLAAAVPEPGTLAMAGLALPLLGLGYLRHRRQTAG